MERSRPQAKDKIPSLPSGWELGGGEYAMCVAHERRMLITPTMQNHACTPECEKIVTLYYDRLSR